MRRGLDACRSTGRLKDAELSLELKRVPPEGVKSLPDSVRVVTGLRDRQVLDPRERRQRRRLRRCPGLLCGHLFCSSTVKYAAEFG